MEREGRGRTGKRGVSRVERVEGRKGLNYSNEPPQIHLTTVSKPQGIWFIEKNKFIYLEKSTDHKLMLVIMFEIPE